MEGAAERMDRAQPPQSSSSSSSSPSAAETTTTATTNSGSSDHDLLDFSSPSAAASSDEKQNVKTEGAVPETDFFLNISGGGGGGGHESQSLTVSSSLPLPLSSSNGGGTSSHLRSAQTAATTEEQEDPDFLAMVSSASAETQQQLPNGGDMLSLVSASTATPTTIFDPFSSAASEQPDSATFSPVDSLLQQTVQEASPQTTIETTTPDPNAISTAATNHVGAQHADEPLVLASSADHANGRGGGVTDSTTTESISSSASSAPSCNPSQQQPDSTSCSSSSAVESTDDHALGQQQSVGVESSEASVNVPKEEEFTDLPHEQQRVKDLESQLAASLAKVAQHERQEEETNQLMGELQLKLQSQMSVKAEAENACRLLEAKMKSLEEINAKQSQDSVTVEDLQNVLQKHIEAKADDELRAKSWKERAVKLEAKAASEATRISELLSSLESLTSEKDEVDNLSRLQEAKIKDLEEVNVKQSRDLATMADVEKLLQEYVESKAEVQQLARSWEERATELESTTTSQSARMEPLERQLVQTRQDMAVQQEELEALRSERDEQQRKEHALTSRLNAAKREKAEQSDLAERLEDEIKALEQDLGFAKKELAEVIQAKVLQENELEVLKKTSENRVRHVEAALADERNLNEERKRKMKLFVENKSEELRQAKVDNDSLQSELAQTNKSLLDLNNRWKQLHAQWVQSQTRNRELQRDLNRIKKDSENLHKVGDTLGMKLSRSATETEEHKNKRLAAKHELMTVLRTLEAEQELTAKLRDSLKFTFTPKALSQQQLLTEGLQDFESQLQKLASRLGRPLPPTPDMDVSMTSDTGDPSDAGLAQDGGIDLVNGGDDAVRLSRPDTEIQIQRLISKLEYETQRVSQGIMALSGSIERMHLVLDTSGDRTCYTVLSELLATGAVRTTTPASTTAEETNRFGSIRSPHQYGHIPSAARD